MTKPVVGFIGVGLMGHGMARNILAAGYPLVVVAHRNRGPVEDLIARGATEAGTVAELASQAEVIHICVSGSPQVEAVIRGTDGIAANAAPGSIVIDCSTSNPVSTLELSAELALRDIALADAPLGRTPKEALAGTLDTMVGADPETYARIEPILQTWAGNIVHLGPVGSGHKMKLVNNFISLGYGALYAEALAIARKSGLSVEQFHSVIGTSRMRNGFYDTFMKWSLERDENAHRFSIANAHKDMRYLTALSMDVGAVNPVQSAVRNSLAAMEAAGQGEKYLPMLADFVAAANGLPEKD
ncbi:NAD(P)-dependent oxidoreductase [Tropicimonas sp. IMCC34043]|uniref:NAD(P)-dependent oxidoreductase n=1 Tax=Tropicimonas sp. IMCC34043 TaxID=2248760 RepID=UPI000E256208|nr:NAD(P)-dependent oxidoreductase [Tropicimonas sp. IMCC34043]